MTTQEPKQQKWDAYYDQGEILDEITEEPVTFSVDKELVKDILSGNRKRKLKNISIKMDPLHVSAIKKLATMKSIPYQTLMRHWLAEDIRKELDAFQK